jgi:hypothetical protein
MPFSPSLGRPAPVQGRREAIAFEALEYFIRLGLVSRVKEHAFATTAEDLGWEIRPDFFALAPPKRKVVIEVKAARYLSAAVEKMLRANREGLAEFGLEYLVWTDRHPLTPWVQHNLLQMHRFAGPDVPGEEVEALAQLIQERQEVTLRDLLRGDFDLGCVFSAWTRGKVFLSLFAQPTVDSKVSVRPLEDLGSIFLDTDPIGDTWWNELAGA